MKFQLADPKIEGHRSNQSSYIYAFELYLTRIRLCQVRNANVNINSRKMLIFPSRYSIGCPRNLLELQSQNPRSPVLLNQRSIADLVTQ